MAGPREHLSLYKAPMGCVLGLSAWELICLLKVYKLDAMTFENYSRSPANGVRWMTQYKGV